jgi:hypothetical protein
MPISDSDYNQATSDLDNSKEVILPELHIVKHTRGKGSPDGHGRQLIIEAIQEFRLLDAGAVALTGGMTIVHFVAVSNAATEMELDIEDIFKTMGE